MRRVLVLVLVVGSATACGGRDRGSAEPVFQPVPSESATITPTAEPSVAPTTPTGRPTPTRSPTRRPAPTRKPIPPQPAPPPPAPPAPGCTAPKYVGPAAARAQVKTALEAAAAKTYWPVSAPSIKVPVELVKAVAWLESGWQSNIVACDTGIGLMQVQPPTAKFVNDRFDKSYDVNKYQDNAILGANYLAWLTKSLGDDFFNGNYDLTVRDPDNIVLLDAVIAAYNVGPGGVNKNNVLTIPNRQYVNNVERFMVDCVCLT